MKPLKYMILFLLFMAPAVVGAALIAYFWTTIRAGSTEPIMVILLVVAVTALLCVVVYDYIEQRYD